MLRSVLAFIALATVMGCAHASSPLTGFVYTELNSGLGATSNQAGNRVGEACGTSILGWVATGDATIETARRNGGITMISSIDEKAESILGVWAKYCVVVRGR